VRAEARHQLKQDRLSKATFEAAEKTVDWTVEHQGKLIVAAVAVVVIAAILGGGWYYMRTQNEKASVDLSVAVRTFEAPVRPAGMPPQPGYESYASFEERATTARKQFQAIIDNYPHTKTADMARYFVGLACQQLNDQSAAERNLQEVANSSNKNLAALGKLALASVYRSEKKDTQSVDLYMQLIGKPTITVSKATAQLELAGYYESTGKPDQAKKIYDQVQKENPSSEAASIAQRRGAALK
jgi:TolA-binding protein